jgi:U3 small nucleolar RNA-associated protein 14
MLQEPPDLRGAFSEIKSFKVSKRLDSALKKVVPNISRPKKSRHFLMKLPDNFQMREHSWPCRLQQR